MNRLRARAGQCRGLGRPPLRTALVLVGFSLAYLLGGELGLRLRMPDTGVAVFWPAAGIAVGVIARARTRPGLLLATLFVTNAVHEYVTRDSVVLALGLGAANTLEAALAALALRRRPRPFLQDVGDLARLCGVAGLATALAAVLGAATLGTAVAGVDVSQVFLTWWLADFVGLVVVSSPILLLDGPSAERTASASRRWLLELVVSALVLAATTGIVFGYQPGGAGVQTEYLFLPVLVVVAVRLGAKEVGGLVAGLACLVGLLTARGKGSFSVLEGGLELLVLQGFLAVVCVSVLSLALTIQRHAATTEDLGRNQDFIRSVLAAATESSIIATDRHGLITVFNSGAEKLLGYQAEEMVGRRTPEVIHLPDEVVARAHELGIAPGFDVFVHSARRDEPESREWTYVRKDGSHVTVALQVSAVHDQAGVPIGYLGVARDVTEERRRADALRAALAHEQQAMEELRDLDRVKSDFVSSVSHELRTPLTSITGYLEVMLDGDVGEVSPAQRDALEVAGRNCQRLLLLIEDLLTLSRVESGSFSLDIAPVAVSPMLASAVQAIAPLAAARPLDLVVDVPRDVGTVLGDAAQIERVVLNLLSNAVKFTEPGGRVELGARASGDSLVLTVRDTGVGIAAADQPHVFTRFFRSGEARNRAIQGTGLGLSIAKTIVEQHGGEIRVTSTAGTGTTMTVRLPRAPAAPAGPPPNGRRAVEAAAVAG